MTEPFNRRKLERYRVPALEAAVIAAGQQSRTPTAVVIGGDIVIGSRKHAKSIRFTFTDVPEPGYEGEWIMSLSAQAHSQCTDGDVRRFCKYAEVTDGGLRFSGDMFPAEMRNQGRAIYVRSFKLRVPNGQA